MVGVDDGRVGKRAYCLLSTTSEDDRDCKK